MNKNSLFLPMILSFSSLLTAGEFQSNGHTKEADEIMLNQAMKDLHLHELQVIRQDKLLEETLQEFEKLEEEEAYQQYITNIESLKDQCLKYAGPVPKNIYNIASQEAQSFGLPNVHFYLSDHYVVHSRIMNGLKYVGLTQNDIDQEDFVYVGPSGLAMASWYSQFIEILFHEFCHLKAGHKENLSDANKVLAQEMEAELGARYYLVRIKNIRQPWQYHQEEHPGHPTNEEHARYVEELLRRLDNNPMADYAVVKELAALYVQEKRSGIKAIFEVNEQGSYTTSDEHLLEETLKELVLIERREKDLEAVLNEALNELEEQERAAVGVFFVSLLPALKKCQDISLERAYQNYMKKIESLKHECLVYAGPLPKDIYGIAQREAVKMGVPDVNFFLTDYIIPISGTFTTGKFLGIRKKELDRNIANELNIAWEIHFYCRLYHELCHLKARHSTHDPVIRLAQEMEAELGARYYLYLLRKCKYTWAYHQAEEPSHPTNEEHARYINELFRRLDKDPALKYDAITELAAVYLQEKRTGIKAKF